MLRRATCLFSIRTGLLSECYTINNWDKQVGRFNFDTFIFQKVSVSTQKKKTTTLCVSCDTTPTTSGIGSHSQPCAPPSCILELLLSSLCFSLAQVENEQMLRERMLVAGKSAGCGQCLWANEFEIGECLSAATASASLGLSELVYLTHLKYSI